MLCVRTMVCTLCVPCVPACLWSRANGRSNAKKHLEGVECCSLAALKGLKANDLKAMGFKPEVRSRLQKHIADDSAVADYKEEEAFVTVDEEEEAIESKTSTAGKKKKSGKKGGAKKEPSAAAHTPVPGEGGEAMDPGFQAFLTSIGLAEAIPKFQESHITSLESCRLMTKASLMSSLAIPDAKAGRILSQMCITSLAQGEVPIAAQRGMCLLLLSVACLPACLPACP